MRSRSASARCRLRGQGQLRIKVAASTVNPMDWHLATGSPGIVRLAEGFRRPKHEIPGREACGVVDQLGSGVTDFEIGQSVFGWVTGAFAEYAIAEADRMWPAPTEMTDVRVRRTAGCRRDCAGSNRTRRCRREASRRERRIRRGRSLRRADRQGARSALGRRGVFQQERGFRAWARRRSGRRVRLRGLHVRALGCDHRLHREPHAARRSGRALVDDGRWVVVGDHQEGRIARPAPPPGGEARALALRVAVVSLVRSRRGCAVPRGTRGTRRRGPRPLTSERDRHHG